MLVTGPASRRPSRLVVAGLAIAVAAYVLTLHPSASSSVGTFGELLLGDHHGGLGPADGALADEVSVFDRTPAVDDLDPALLHALRGAAVDASRDGVRLRVNSGWRSARYQEALLREAIKKYGSRAAAARWVATPRTSPHVSGDAVDVGPTDAADWLERNGAGYGLCRIYGNEPWHFELRRGAAQHGCPPTYADPTQDPRMQP
jgi:zinc D-Ala-D-Ala carboxypeptidase